jgi:ubiquinone/menaquinone biosynthesis C-methylase UbiE
MKSKEISGAAQAGFAAADAYDAHRPSYPDEAVEQFLRGLEIAGVKGAKVADLAAGTGKFTEILARRPEEYDIVAIEPHDGMRAQLQQKGLPRVRVIPGTGDDLSEIPDEGLAAVVAAQVSTQSVSFVSHACWLV